MKSFVVRLLLAAAAWLVGPSASFSWSPSGGTTHREWLDQLSSLLPQSAKPLVVCTTAPSLEGLAFCRAVLARDRFRVRALARNVDSPRARELRAMGCEVVRADNRDVASLRRALRGAHGVYGITTWSGSTFGADGAVRRAADLDSRAREADEIAQGRNILRAAETVPTLRHFVLQSMHRGGRDVPIRDNVEAPLHHRAKWAQEEMLRQSALPCWSVLRQPTYLENFDNDDAAAQGTKLRLLRPGVVSGLLDRDVPLTVVAVRDLGFLAARMFEDRPRYAGRVLRAGCERTTGRRLTNAASRVNGDIKFRYRPLPWPVLEYLIPVEYPKQLKRWLTFGGNDEGAVYDVATSGDDNEEEEREPLPPEDDFIRECYELHPDMMGIDDWLRTRGVDKMERSKNLVELLKEKTQELASS